MVDFASKMMDFALGMHKDIEVRGLRNDDYLC